MRNILIVMVLLLIMTGCRTTRTIEKEIPIETVRTEYKTDSIYVYKNLIEKDSTYTKDSIQIMYKDSLVYIDRWHTEYRDRKVANTDTIYKDRYIHITDSIDRPVYITKTEYVEKKLNWIQQTLIYLGLLALAMIGFRIYRLFRP